MKKFIYSILIILCLIVIIACNKQEVDNKSSKQETIINEKNEEKISMKISINNNEYTINLEDNETVKELVSMLPLELNMSELNGNEKYTYLDESLPTNSYNPKHISSGDVMLFGDNCLVIFYDSFNTSYSYTKIGHIDNMPNLGKENIKVVINK